MYGVYETNPKTSADTLPADAPMVEWTEPGLKVTRLRMVSDPGYPYWDITYCYGILPDGTRARVQLPFSQLPKHNWAGIILNHAKADKVYAKGLEIFKNVSKLC